MTCARSVSKLLTATRVPEPSLDESPIGDSFDGFDRDQDHAERGEQGESQHGFYWRCETHSNEASDTFESVTHSWPVVKYAVCIQALYVIDARKVVLDTFFAALSNWLGRFVVTASRVDIFHETAPYDLKGTSRGFVSLSQHCRKAAESVEYK